MFAALHDKLESDLRGDSRVLSYPQENHTMSGLKETMQGLSAELKAAADANDMRLVHEVQQKIAGALDAPEEESNGKRKAK